MSAERNIDVLLGDPRKAVLAMAIPIMVSLFVAEINTVVDRAWCSGMGSDPLAAVAIVRPFYNV
ncbi:MAG: MATE family efflux transporter, partial [archaeon]|nr:MATE family efflux transporter [archaeon]